ncbi:glutathione hydrolase 1 proenzyme-like isoform X2 [Physella acuta]|uniref:glutathione hydrolase 1 proenzyme-like isoform X2 n=1 Tax=Physella acuta TaxID=109671 RepID=UPI0027DAE783|nr:glutathione hydrolase 1 proenzyme-like isoform X2 [Physella acuta]
MYFKRPHVLLITVFPLLGTVVANSFLPDFNPKAVEKKCNSYAKDGGYGSAVVAADSFQCSTVGKNILRKDGNAVDAAIATLLCTGLTSPQSMGLGGGFFMTIFNTTSQKSTVIDARETAPEKARADMFAKNPIASFVGGLSIAVPSEIKGYWYAHQKYGRLPWSDLFQPAIKMATDGFLVEDSLANVLKIFKRMLSKEKTMKDVFINNSTKKVFKKGEKMKRPQLAKTLQVIAKEGMKALYDGSLTNDLMEDLKEIGSIITRNDLKNYKVLEKRPVEILLNDGLRAVTVPAPGGGPILALILHILNGYNLTPESVETDAKRTQVYHRIAEAFKFAYAKRTEMGDEMFMNSPGFFQNLSSREYAEEMRCKLSDTQTHDVKYYGPTYDSKITTGTSHLSVIDDESLAVSVTSTINARFGSQVRGMRTGIIFNDEMDDFSTPNVTNYFGFEPSPANFIAPGKRPVSSMCPTIFIDRQNYVSKILGAAGGSRITSATALVAAHVIWLGDTLREAMYRPRLHHQLVPNQLEYEVELSPVIVEGLRKMGHKMAKAVTVKSVVQGINMNTRKIYAESDPRFGGAPSGY